MPQVDQTDLFRRLFYVLGETLYFWQSVERGLFSIYVAPFERPPENLLAITFYHIKAFETRIALVDTMLRKTIADEPYVFRREIRKAADCEVLHRNAFVHFEAQGLSETDAALAPSIFDIARYKDGKPNRLYDAA